MADSTLKVLITAVDKLSPVLAKQSRMIRGWSKSFERAGRGAVPMALGLGASLAVTTRAFTEQENAVTQLKNTLMTSDGLTAGFEQLSKIAIDLGNRLPGNTADFAGMASQMKALGVSTDSLIGGSLEAAANLAVVAKPLGVTYDQAAESIGKLGRAFGISGQEMVPFADTLQRALHMGGDLEQMQYAMSRIAGPMKMLGKQGLAAANEMVPLVALLGQAGLQGEAIGTGIQNMVEALTKTGDYKGVQSLVDYLEKIHKLAPAKQLEVLEKLFGQHATKASIIGAGGYNDLVKSMAAQGSMDQRVAKSLGTLTNLIEAATGSLTNLAAAFADAYAPELKSIAVWLNTASGRMMEWVNANKPFINGAVKAAAIFVGLKLAIYGIGIALAFVARMMNPWMLLANGLALMVPVIIANWGTLTNRLKTGWQNAVNFVGTAWNNLVGGIKLGISAMTSAFPMIGEALKATFGGAIDWVIAKWQGLINAVSNGMTGIASFMSGMGGANVGSMTLPGQARKPIVSSGFKGSLDINHVNAPAGFRAAPVQSKGPVRVQQNVGYRYSSTGAR
jgi:TP901 family phage tail tape measure protein